MTDLSVDIAVLEDSKTDLSAIKTALDNIEGRHDDTDHIWGNDRLKDAMHEFATNMHHHRKELSGKVQATYDKVSTTLTTFEEADAKLKSELEKNTQPQDGPR